VPIKHWYRAGHEALEACFHCFASHEAIVPHHLQQHGMNNRRISRFGLWKGREPLRTLSAHTIGVSPPAPSLFAGAAEAEVPDVGDAAGLQRW
jgi:hypothetical protein